MSNPRPVNTGKAFLMYLIVSLFLFFEMAVQVSPSVMSFQLMHDLSISAFGLGVMSGCYFYTYTAMQIPSGLLFDRLKPRFVICVSLLICAIGCVLLGLADNFITACLARLFMGLGSAFAFVSVLVVTKDLFSHRAFATMTGITQMLAALGAMSGQLPVSSLVASIGWRHSLFVFAVIGAVLALAIYYFLRYEAGHPCTNKPSPSGIWVDIKAIIARPQTWFIGLYACVLWAPMAGFTSLWGVPFLVKVDHFTTGNSAFLVSLMWLGLALGSPVLGALSTRMNSRKWPLAGSALIGAVSFAFVLYVPLSAWVLGVLLFLAGAACAGQALSFTVIKENNDPQRVATAIAINNMAVVISGAVFQPVIGWLISVLGPEHYQAALSLILGAYVVGVLSAVCLIRESMK